MELRRAADVKRAARSRLADVTVALGPASPDVDVVRGAYDVATRRWVELIRVAVQTGVSIAEVARAAGVAPSSVHYRVRSGSVSTAADQVNQDRPRSSVD